MGSIPKRFFTIQSCPPVAITGATANGASFKSSSPRLGPRQGRNPGNPWQEPGEPLAGTRGTPGRNPGNPWQEKTLTTFSHQIASGKA